MRWFKTKGAEAARLRKRKYELARRYGFDAGLLPGSLTLTHRRCGKPTCHCANGEGHPMWVLSFSINGQKRVEVIPEELALELKPLVDRGREHREALSEFMRLNAQLLRLWLGEEREKKKARATHRRKSAGRTPAR